MEQLYRDGKVKSIGVSNYTIEHLEELLSKATIRPHILQVEFHPLLHQQKLLDYCREHDIVFEAYSSLGEGHLVDGRIPIVELSAIAKKHHASPSSILLRWALQKQIIIIPKSTHLDRVKQNLEESMRIELDPVDMQVLDSLTTGGQGEGGNGKYPVRRFCWDPHTVV